MMRGAVLTAFGDLDSVEFRKDVRHTITFFGIFRFDFQKFLRPKIEKYFLQSPHLYQIRPNH
jgi:hypothetical protein